jgi:hypothetical protein
MGSLSRDKGIRGELEIAKLISDELGYPITRRVRNHLGDSDLLGVPGWSLEVKRVRTASEGLKQAWWHQTITQSKKTLPALFWRVDRASWRVVWPLSVTLSAPATEKWCAYDWTCETSVSAWCAVVREYSEINLSIDLQPASQAPLLPF